MAILANMDMLLSVTNAQKRAQRSRMKQLNDRERAVVKAYVSNGFNKTEAYKSAFPDCSSESAMVSGCRMLNQEHMKVAIQEETEKNISPLKDSKEAIIKEAIEITGLAKDKAQYSAAMKGLDTRAKLGGYYDQDEESGTKYMAFVQQITNNTQFNINNSVKSNQVSKSMSLVDKLDGASLCAESKVIDDNTYDNDGAYDDSVAEVGGS